MVMRRAGGYGGWILALLVGGCVLQDNDGVRDQSADLAGVWGLKGDVIDTGPDSGFTGVRPPLGTTLEFREDGTFQEWSTATVFTLDTGRDVLYTLATGRYRYGADEVLLFDSLDCRKYDEDTDSLQASTCEALDGCARPGSLTATIDSVEGFPPNAYSHNRMLEVRRSGGSEGDTLVCRQWKRKIWEERPD